MLKNYFKIAFRNLLRYKAYSFINISGLAISMASSILILLWVQNELSYDRFHIHADQLYRITPNASDFKVAVNPAAMPGALKKEIPAIKEVVRITEKNVLFESGDRKFDENVFYVDSTFFDLFSFAFKKGNRNTALQREDAVLITEAMAKNILEKKMQWEKPSGKIMANMLLLPVYSRIFLLIRTCNLILFCRCCLLQRPTMI